MLKAIIDRKYHGTPRPSSALSFFNETDLDETEEARQIKARQKEARGIEAKDESDRLHAGGKSHSEADLAILSKNWLKRAATPATISTSTGSSDSLGLLVDEDTADCDDDRALQPK